MNVNVTGRLFYERTPPPHHPKIKGSNRVISFSGLRPEIVGSKLFTMGLYAHYQKRNSEGLRLYAYNLLLKRKCVQWLSWK